MTPEQFAYWLQGFAEINQEPPTEAQWTIVKDHLATVFKKVTPTYPIMPGIAAPYAPMPIPWTTSPTITPFTTPNYPKPEIICSAGINAAGGTGFSATYID